MKKAAKEVLGLIKLVVVILVTFTVLYSQVFALIKVEQSSMEETLMEGQILILEKLTYQFSKPTSGDIVVFLRDDSCDGILKKLNIFFNDLKLKVSGESRDDRLIKRVVAVAGDEINIKDGELFINGIEQQEVYTKTITAEKGIKTKIVPDGCVFVMGDNRDASTDSRTFGPIAINQIEGKVILRVAPISEFGTP